MSDQSISHVKHPALLLMILAMMLFVSLIFSIFLHEDGHGLGAKIDGVHVSTGFNKVGDYGKYPDDPDFRSSGSDGALWSSLLGPVTTWVLAIVFTIWLYRFNNWSWGAFFIGTLAVANGLIRTLPMLSVLLCNLLGNPHLEDEVGWGIWYILKYCRPDLGISEMDFHVLLQIYPQTFLKDLFFWIPPLFSLAISLACLILAYRHIDKLLGDRFTHWANRLISGFLPVAAYIAVIPVLNWLDRLIRINW